MRPVTYISLPNVVSHLFRTNQINYGNGLERNESGPTRFTREVIAGTMRGTRVLKSAYKSVKLQVNVNQGLLSTLPFGPTRIGIHWEESSYVVSMVKGCIDSKSRATGMWHPASHNRGV